MIHELRKCWCRSYRAPTLFKFHFIYPLMHTLSGGASASACCLWTTQVARQPTTPTLAFVTILPAGRIAVPIRNVKHQQLVGARWEALKQIALLLIRSRVNRSKNGITAVLNKGGWVLCFINCWQIIGCVKEIKITKQIVAMWKIAINTCAEFTKLEANKYHFFLLYICSIYRNVVLRNKKFKERQYN